MYERFTDRARTVMQRANYEAQQLNHEYIGTEHILLGLISEGSGVAANVLKNLDVNLRKIRLEVEKLVQGGPDTVTMGKLPQTPSAKRVIEYSMEEARNLNHNYVGTEHLLLGLLREEEGVAAQVLMNLGLRLEELRQEILSLLGSSTVESRQTPTPVTLTAYDQTPNGARAVILRANQEAQRFHHEYIGTEHLLLGLIGADTGTAIQVLRNLDVDARRIRLEIEKLLQHGPTIVTTGKLPLTPRAKSVIEYSNEEAGNLKHNYIGTEHVLLGLLREQEGVAAQVLMNLGLTLEKTRREVLNVVGSGTIEVSQISAPPVSAPQTRSAPMRELVVAKINLDDLDRADARRKPNKVIASRNSSTGKSPGLLLFVAGMVVGWLLCWLILG